MDEDQRHEQPAETHQNPEPTRPIEHQEAHPIQEQADHKPHHTEQSHWGLTRYEFVSALIQGGLVLATSIYAGLVYLQWDALNATLNEVKRQTQSAQVSAHAAQSAAETAAAALTSSVTSFKQQVRPYVIAESIRINQKPTEHVIAGIETVLRNTGTTPAVHLRIYHTFSLESGLPLLASHPGS